MASKTKQSATDQALSPTAQDGSAKAKPVKAQAKAVPAPKADKKGAKGSKGSKGKSAKPGLIARVKGYFQGVRQETKRVVWPSRSELIKYSGAVVAMLVFFGLLIYIVDSAVVPALLAFSGLRG